VKDRSDTTSSSLRPTTGDGSFPKYRLYVYLAPSIFVFLFFPFRLLQWISLLAIAFISGACGLSYLVYRGTKVAARSPLIYSHRGDEVLIELEVCNRAPVAAVNLGITLFTPSERTGEQKIQGLLSLPPKGSERFTARITMTRRGEYSISPVILEGSDPFSLFPWRSSFRDIASLVVYPSIHSLDAVPKRGIPGGPIRVTDRLYEDPSRIGSIRDYIPGDDIRRIHWNATARLGSLCTVLYLPAMDSPVVVILDLSSPAYPDRFRYSRLEFAVEIAASLVHSLGNASRRVAFVSNGFDGTGRPVIPPEGQIGSAALALRVLARITPDDTTTDPVSLFLSSAIPVRTGMGCFIISPRPPSDLAPQLAHPSMVTLRPVYFHLGDRRRPPEPGTKIEYRFVDDPKELSRYARSR
jgi:uncharacterized protein (DUF58 family)